jgi:hypothetical protein
MRWCKPGQEVPFLQGCALPLLSTVARCGDDPHGRTTAYLQAFLAGRPHVAAATGRRPKTSTFAPTPPRIAEVPLICPDKPACLSQCAALHRCPSSFALVYHSHSSSSAAQARRPRPRTSPPCRSSAKQRRFPHLWEVPARATTASRSAVPTDASAHLTARQVARRAIQLPSMNPVGAKLVARIESDATVRFLQAACCGQKPAAAFL